MWNFDVGPTVPPERVPAYQPDHAHVDTFDAIRGLAMNLAVPPFDDVHIRRAVNYAVDKQRLIELHGGPLAVEAASHMAPDGVQDNLLFGYDPYSTPGQAGDMVKARDEMAQSEYDSDGDGRCDAPVCRGVRAVTREPYGDIGRAVRDDLQGIGILLNVEVLDSESFFGAYVDPRQKVPLFVGIGWTKSYISAASFFYDQFYGPAVLAEDFGNGTLVGATTDLLRAWGYDEGLEVPNIDARIEACLPLTGVAAFECWAALDQYVMENVVPWVPYAADKFVAITSQRVVHYSFDQLFVSPALDQIAVSG